MITAGLDGTIRLAEMLCELRPEAVILPVKHGSIAVSRRPNFPKVEIQQAEGMVAAALRLEPGATVVSRHQERFIDEAPRSLHTSVYPMALVEQGAVELVEASSLKRGASRYIDDTLAIEGLRQIVVGRAPNEKERAFFNARRGCQHNRKLPRGY